MPESMLHIDLSPLEECKHPEWTYGEICVKCNECGRFDKGGANNPVRSEVYLISQWYSGIPPLWHYPEERAHYFDDKWCKPNQRIKDAGTFAEAMPECWHKRELDYVRWWIEGRNY